MPMQNPGFTTTLEGDKLAVSMTDGGHLTISKNEGELQVRVGMRCYACQSVGHISGF